MAASDPTASGLRRMILAFFYLGVAATLAELYLLEHTESALQLAPFWALAAAAVTGAVAALRPGTATVRVMQGTMVLIAAVGLVGLVLHYRANVEFELERAPDLRGWPLFRAAIEGAMPALAPALMAQIGLLGLAYTYRHPALTRTALRKDDIP